MDIDKLWSRVTQIEKKACWTYTRDLFRLASLTFALSNYTQTLAHTLTQPFDHLPSSLCSNGGVGEWAGRAAEDAGPGEPQLHHPGEEDLSAEPPAADRAIR